MSAETTKQGIRARTLFDELLPASHSRRAIHAALAGVVGELVPAEDEDDAPSAPALVLPQDGGGWLLTDAEADEVRRRVEADVTDEQLNARLAALEDLTEALTELVREMLDEVREAKS